MPLGLPCTRAPLTRLQVDAHGVAGWCSSGCRLGARGTLSPSPSRSYTMYVIHIMSTLTTSPSSSCRSSSACAISWGEAAIAAVSRAPSRRPCACRAHGAAPLRWAAKVCRAGAREGAQAGLLRLGAGLGSRARPTPDTPSPLFGLCGPGRAGSGALCEAWAICRPGRILRGAAVRTRGGRRAAWARSPVANGRVAGDVRIEGSRGRQATGRRRRKVEGLRGRRRGVKKSSLGSKGKGQRAVRSSYGEGTPAGGWYLRAPGAAAAGPPRTGAQRRPAAPRAAGSSMGAKRVPAAPASVEARRRAAGRKPPPGSARSTPRRASGCCALW